MTDTLKDAQDYVVANREEGVTCPCCFQFAKTYRRSLNSGVSRCLIALYRAGGDKKYIYTPNHVDPAGKISKAAYWRLVERDLERGWWMLTELGTAFVLGKAQVGRFAVIYNGDLIEIDDDELIWIWDSLGIKFNYRDLMDGV